jgi:phenylpropionate dioxygenase-like ring-hydroxylating dioxygenase large terminal subunit
VYDPDLMSAPREVAAGRAKRDLRRIGANPDFWYPLAWSRQVKAGSSLAVSFAGDPIVLVRGASGAVFALENRCAHRQIPLSSGIVCANAIRCGYHGWTYDAGGACIDVPYLGAGKLPNGVRSYPCREEQGLIFVFPGDPARAGGVPFPALVAAGDKTYKTRRFGREVSCHYSFMHENLMDMNHQFLHRRLMGLMKPHYKGHERGEDWIEVRYSFSRVQGKQPLGEALILGQKRDDRNITDVMTIRTDYPYQTLRIRTGERAPVMDLWIAYVPVDGEQRTHRTFGLLSIQRPKMALVLDAAWPALIWFTEAIFKEDRAIVELEQSAHDAQGADWNQEIFPVIRDLREVLRENGVAIG